MKKILPVLLFILLGCNSVSKTGNPPPPIPNITGPTEILLTSSTGNLLYAEAVFAESGGAISSTSAQIVGQDNHGNLFLGGFCPSTQIYSVFGNASASQAVTFTVNDGGSPYTLTGSFNGARTTGTFSGCTDTGTFATAVVGNLSGNFAGWLTLRTNGHHDHFTLNLTEAADHTLVVSGSSTGNDVGALTLNGPVIANYFTVTGQVGGSPVTFDCLLIGNTISVMDTGGHLLGTWGRV